MSKSIKRFKKYSEEYEEDYYDHDSHRERLKEKRLAAALKTKNLNALMDIEEEY